MRRMPRLASYWKHCPECGWKVKVYSRTKIYYCVQCTVENEDGPKVKLVDGYD